jgi:hypothetical protein
VRCGPVRICKWGCYNELVILGLIAALEAEGRAEDARWLRAEWEKKVKYFIYDDAYPFRSEYSFDTTAFESSHAIARYALANELVPDENSWYDVNLKKWWSHPEVPRQAVHDFMDRQLRANLAARGMIEPPTTSSAATTGAGTRWPELHVADGRLGPARLRAAWRRTRPTGCASVRVCSLLGL